MHTSLLLQCNYKLTVLNRIITILTHVDYSCAQNPSKLISTRGPNRSIRSTSLSQCMKINTMALDSLLQEELELKCNQYLISCFIKKRKNL
jgi:hypothetical protein